MPHVGTFVDRALACQFSYADAAAFQEMVGRFIVPKSGQPGAGTMHNANAFAGSFLRFMSERMPDGRVKLKYVHDMFSDPVHRRDEDWIRVAPICVVVDPNLS